MEEIFKAFETLSSTVENLREVVERQQHLIDVNDKAIETLQDRVDDLELKLKYENTNNLDELFKGLNPTK